MATTEQWQHDQCFIFFRKKGIKRERLNSVYGL